MAYIAIEDFKLFIQELFLEEATEADDALIAQAITLAEEEVYSHIAQRYDAEAEFALTGAARNAAVVRCAVDIALYHIHSRIAPNQVPTVRNDRYSDAITWLRDVSAGNVNPRLAPKVDENTDDQTALFRMGSNQRFRSEY